MGYTVQVTKPAAKDIAELPESVKARVEAAITVLADAPSVGFKLKGRFEGLWAVRVGNYRITYRLSKRERNITFVSVAHHREAYR